MWAKHRGIPARLADCCQSPNIQHQMSSRTSYHEVREQLITLSIDIDDKEKVAKVPMLTHRDIVASRLARIIVMHTLLCRNRLWRAESRMRGGRSLVLRAICRTGIRPFSRYKHMSASHLRPAGSEHHGIPASRLTYDNICLHVYITHLSNNHRNFKLSSAGSLSRSTV
jgi:hypothetical protein